MLGTEIKFKKLKFVQLAEPTVYVPIDGFGHQGAPITSHLAAAFIMFIGAHFTMCSNQDENKQIQNFYPLQTYS